MKKLLFSALLLMGLGTSVHAFTPVIFIISTTTQQSGQTVDVSSVIASSVTAGGINVSALSASQMVGTDSLSNLISLNISTSPLVNVQNIYSYRRPNLLYLSTFSTTIESGIIDGSANPTIMFPDGSKRTETLTSNDVFFATQTAIYNVSYSSGNAGGMRQQVIANNETLAIYAVKVNANSTDFVLVADTITCTKANYATLNTNFGVNGWIYLGSQLYGDRGGSANTLLKFVQAGPLMKLLNANSGGSAVNSFGWLLMTSAGATSLGYSYNVGFSSAAIPGNFSYLEYEGCWAGSGSSSANSIQGSGGNILIRVDPAVGATTGAARTTHVASDGITITGGASQAMDLYIQGWVDNALGVGSNPLF